MAKLLRGILGGISGKIGAIVGATWRSIEYVRSLPKETKIPRTEQQLQQQAKFKYLHEFLAPFKSFFTIGFMNEATHMTEMNVAHTLNYKSALLGIHPNYSIDFSGLVMSKGDLANVFEPAIGFLTDQVLELKWLNQREKMAKADDQITLMLYDKENGKVDGFIGGMKRSMESCTFKLHPKSVGKELEAYVSTSSLDRKKVSNSLYLGAIRWTAGY